MESKPCILFEAVVGTYEEFVLGYQFSLDKNSNEAKLAQTFATRSHRASVRSVACHGKLLVSGGADEVINIYNMLTRKECGMLMEHDGTITSLNWTPDGSHLISTSDDGSVKVWRQGSWQIEKIWSSAHKGQAVKWLSIHPSGKMALSVGRDHTLRTWNLVKGRPAYTTNLYSRCRQLEYVVWSPGGVLFAIPMETKIELTSTDKGGVVHTLQLPTKVTTCIFLTDEVLCVGEESGALSGHSTESGLQLWSVEGSERIRGLAALHDYLVVATSAGNIQVYRIEEPTTQPQIVTSANTGCRITCLTLYDFKREMRVKTEPTEESKLVEKDNATEICAQKKKRKISLSEDEKDSAPRIDRESTTHKKSKKIYQSEEAIGQEIMITNKKPPLIDMALARKQNNITTYKKSHKNINGTFEEEDQEKEIHKHKKKNKAVLGRSQFEECVAEKNSKGSSKKRKTIKGAPSNCTSLRNQKWTVQDSSR